MAIPLFAFVLVLGTAVGDFGLKASAEKLPPPATVADLQLEKAARDYRIQTYETFRNDRAEYNRRQAEAVRIQAAWADAGSNREEQPKLIAWFEQATARSRTDSIGNLPEVPKFTAPKIAVVPPENESETETMEAVAAASVREVAAKVDDLLHLKPAGSAEAATKPSVNPPAKSLPNPTAAATSQEAKGTAVPPQTGEPQAKGPPSKSPESKLPDSKSPQSKSAESSPAGVIGSLPNKLETEIIRQLHGLSGKPTPRAP
jgi:hypothetical protein